MQSGKCGVQTCSKMEVVSDSIEKRVDINRCLNLTFG